MPDLSRSRILLIEDDPPLAKVYQKYLRDERRDVAVAETGTAGIKAIQERAPEVIVLDIMLPDMSGLDVLQFVTDRGINSTVVVITAHGSINTAVDAMRRGAFDFIVKPFTADRLRVTVRNALERHELSETIQTFRDEHDRQGYGGLIGSSPPMQVVYRIIENVAPSKATVFITGETGTGKELCAEAIHLASPQSESPFIALNCAAIPKDLMESEVFGHVKGAFTGAVGAREGAASLAQGGTLFLDEICEMDLKLQSKFLRFVQSGTFQKVGSSKTEHVDIRFICATNRDPWEEVEAGRFREDLYYRLHVIPLPLPPLRQREDDVLTLGRHFLTTVSGEEGGAFGGFSAEAEQAIVDYSWPGNVRQLQNVIRNVVVLNDGDIVTKAMLPDLPGGSRDRAAEGIKDDLEHRTAQIYTPGQTPGDDATEQDGRAPRIRPMREMEMELIEEAVKACNGSLPKAAALLELSPSTLYRRIKANAQDKTRSQDQPD